MVTTSTIIPKSKWPAEVLNQAVVLDALDGNLELMRELVAMFLEDCPNWLREIEDAVAHQDAPLLRRAAHTLKGAASLFRAAATCEAARLLERMGRAGDLTEAAEAYDDLQAAVHQLTPALSDFLRH